VDRGLVGDHEREDGQQEDDRKRFGVPRCILAHGSYAYHRQHHDEEHGDKERENDRTRSFRGHGQLAGADVDVRRIQGLRAVGSSPHAGGIGIDLGELELCRASSQECRKRDRLTVSRAARSDTQPEATVIGNDLGIRAGTGGVDLVRRPREGGAFGQFDRGLLRPVERIRRARRPLPDLWHFFGRDGAGQRHHAEHGGNQENRQAEPDGPPIFLNQQWAALRIACHQNALSLLLSKSGIRF
jgi:hypothetical protein